MTIYKPNFEVDSQKFLYVDIWSLVVSPDGSNVFAAKDNECIIADFCKSSRQKFWILYDFNLFSMTRSFLRFDLSLEVGNFMLLSPDCLIETWERQFPVFEEHWKGIHGLFNCF